MAYAQASLDDAGLSLWLTDRKYVDGRGWRARSLLAVVDRRIAARLAFVVHPDGHAVSVKDLATSSDFGRRGLASVLMDALYGAHPTAWIDHGIRTRDGCRWWDRYADPAPERNIHNRPPVEWATYFDASLVGGQRARNAYLSESMGLTSHRAAQYRYRSRAEAEADAQRWAKAFRRAWAAGTDPAHQDLYAGMRLTLRPGMHRWLLDGSVDATERAHVLLDHIGHGNLPHGGPAQIDPGFWNTAEMAAFDDTAQAELRDGPPERPTLHVAFRILPLPSDSLPSFDARQGYVEITELTDVPVQVAGMSWRPSDRPWAGHTAAFAPAIDAAIQPWLPDTTTPAYDARYDVSGHLRTTPETAQRIADFADKIIRASQARMATAPPAPGPGPGKPSSYRHQPPPGAQPDPDRAGKLPGPG
jgi:hypothetical protein